MLIFLGFVLIPLAFWSSWGDPYTPVKWALVHWLAFAMGVRMLFGFVELPRVPKWVAWAGAVSLVLFASHIIAGQTPLVSSAVADRISLVVVALYALQRFGDDYLKTCEVVYEANFWSTAAVISVGMAQFMVGTGAHGSTFGNTNMVAEFVGFSLLVQRFWPTDSKRPTWLMYLSGAYLLLLGCRSVLFGLLLTTPFFFKTRPSGKKLALAGLSVVIALVLRGLVTDYKPLANQATANQRLGLWSGAVHMIRDHPDGIGPGRYEFNSVSYSKVKREDLIYLSPHNEFLRFFVEDGLLFGLLMLFALGWAWWIPGCTRFCIPFLILWLAQSLFQFPFEDAYPAFLAAVYTGYALSMRCEVFVRRSPAWLAAGVLILALVSGTITASKYEESQGDFSGACALWRSNWRACVQTWQPARIYDELNREPKNFAAWAALSRTTDGQERCSAVWNYDRIFDFRGTFHDKLKEVCQ